MRRSGWVIILGAGLLLAGCAPTITRQGYIKETYASRGEGCEVLVQKEKRVKEGKGRIVGTMKLGDSGFSTKCSEEDVLRIVKSEACKLGAEAVVLRDIREPDFWSSCYRVTADFVKLSDSADAANVKPDESYSESAVQNRVKKSNEVQILVGVLAGVVGFAIGFMLFSPH